MIEHYNAFISYRHAEKDIKVAKAIQSDLEHFHIPGKIKKKTGIKSINRIFLDKDELGTASDLSAEIAYALEHADYLIVICSTATKESTWVPREIEYFLQNHTRSQVTTVLVDGEPEDVIPDILKYEDRTYQNEYGQSYTVRVPLEPLSCDYRLPHRRAKKEELPRLASALISCSYDELMNRRRQYRIRRLTAIFTAILAVTLAFGTYMLISRKKIRENYDTALRNQSKYLAYESQVANADQQRILAIQLALAALPKDEEDPRPVTPQAIRALTDSTLAYSQLQGNTVTAIWNYDMPTNVADYQVTFSGRYLAGRDTNGNVLVWDTGSHAEVLNLPCTPRAADAIAFLNDSVLLVRSSAYLTAYSVPEGSVLWKYESEATINYDNSYQKWGDGAIAVATSGGSNSKTFETRMLKISVSNGSIIDSYSIPADENAISKPVISPDGNRLAFYTDSTGNVCNLMVYNFGTKKTTKELALTTDRIRDIYWGDDAHLMLAYSTDSTSSMSMADVSYIKTDHSKILCLNPDTLTEIWSADFDCSDVMVQSGFLELPKNESIAYFCGNHAEIYKLSDGTPIADHRANSPIIDISDNDGNGWPMYITRNGALALPVSTDQLRIVPCMLTRLSKATVANGIFVNRITTSQIIHYQSSVYDEEWTRLTDKPLSYFYENYQMDEGALAILSEEDHETYPNLAKGDEKIDLLTIINPLSGELEYQIPLVKENGEQYIGSRQLLGSAGGSYYIAFCADGIYSLISVDLASGKLACKELFQTSGIPMNVAKKHGNRLYYVDEDEEDYPRVNIYDFETQKTQTIKAPGNEKYYTPSIAPIWLPEAEAIYYIGLKSEYVIYPDGRPTIEVVLPENWQNTSLVAYDKKSNRFAICDRSSIRFVEADGTCKDTIRCPGATPLGISFYTEPDKDSVLLVAFDDGSLSRYDSTGQFIGKTEISVVSSLTRNASFDFSSSDRLVYLQVGYYTDILDRETWVEEACIYGSLGHHTLSDRFYTFSSKNEQYSIGYFKHYSVDDLIRKANDILQGAEMSDEMKSQYGIEDEEETP